MRLMTFFVLSIVFLTAPSGAIDLQIAAGTTLETNDLNVQIDGQLIEYGYLKGVVSSGSRTGLTAFAGMTLSSGFDGSITRTTGQEYSKDNGEKTNFKRYYELSNTGSIISADMNIDYIGTGVNDERNGLLPDYYIYSYSGTWTTNGNGSPSSPVYAESATIPVGESDWLLADNEFPISIKLVSFTAIPQGGAILLQWQTEHEVNTAGYLVLRSSHQDSGFIRVNDQLIASRGSNSSGATYELLDYPTESGEYFYKLVEVTLDGIVMESDIISIILQTGILARSAPPKDFMLNQNYPNPFNPQTTVVYGIPKTAHVQLVLYNIRGEVVRQLVNRDQPPGTYKLVWNGKDDFGLHLPSGVYLYRMVADEFVFTRKLLLAK